MKIASAFCLFLALSACNRGIQNKDAVRQGVVDYLANRPNLSMRGKSVDVTNVTFKDDKAEAQVTFSPKGGPAGAGMTMRYTLEQKDKKWVVVGKADSGQSPHGAGAAAPGMPGMANPHQGGGMQGGGMVDTEKPGGGTAPGMPPGHPPTAGSSPDTEKK